MTIKNHELLRFRCHESPEHLAQVYASEFYGGKNYPPQGDVLLYLQFDITYSSFAAALHHLGFPLTRPVEEFLEGGFDAVKIYFCDDWWRNDEENAPRLDKTHKERNLKWIQTFSKGILLGLLMERWEDVARVCAWVEADLLPEYTGGDFEDELVGLYKSLAAGLRPEPMPGLEDVEAKISKSRKKRPKLLFQAWDAARSGNQTAFNDAFLKAIKHFESGFDSDSPDLCCPFDWIAPHHSVVALAARHKGMKLPELTPLQQAFLISRESLGLAPK